MLKPIVAALISGEVKQIAGRAGSAAVLYLLAGLCIFVGGGFLVGAAYVVAARRYGTVEAAIGFGAGFLLLAAIIWLVNSMRAKAWRRRREQQRGAELKALAAAAVLGALPGLMKSKGGLGAVLLPIIGLVALKIYDENRSDDEEDSVD